jgi:hypothetical protein
MEKGVASYQGARLIHSVTKGYATASWTFYEELAGQTGLPPVVHLLVLVLCANDFSLEVDMSNLFRGLSTFHTPKRATGAGCIVPSLEAIEESARYFHSIRHT